MKEITEALLQKYLSGTASPEERAAVDAFYQSFMEKPSPLAAVQEPEKKQRSEKIWKGISSAIEDANEAEARKEPVKIG